MSCQQLIYVSGRWNFGQILLQDSDTASITHNECLFIYITDLLCPIIDKSSGIHWNWQFFKLISYTQLYKTHGPIVYRTLLLIGLLFSLYWFVISLNQPINTRVLSSCLQWALHTEGWHSNDFDLNAARMMSAPWPVWSLIAGDGWPATVTQLLVM